MRGNFTSLSDLASEVSRIENSKNDYLVQSAGLSMIQDSALAIHGEGHFTINDYAHGQVASKLGIPKQYYDKMSEIEGLRTINVNEWLRKRSDEQQYVRTLDGKVRAFLSERFRPIDNYAVLSSFLPALQGQDVKIQTSALSEKKMYLQILFPKNELEVRNGDVVQQGIILTNSEVGAGAVDVKHMIWRLVCSNGMIGMSVLRKYHIGRTLEDDIFREDTMRAELEAFKLKFRDVIADALSQKNFIEQVNKLKDATEDKIVNVTETVSNVTKRLGLSEKHNNIIIQNMAEEGNMNRYGLANGLTFLAHSLDNIDAQYEVEKYGSQVINMTKTEWNKYAVA